MQQTKDTSQPWQKKTFKKSEFMTALLWTKKKLQCTYNTGAPYSIAICAFVSIKEGSTQKLQTIC